MQKALLVTVLPLFLAACGGGSSPSPFASSTPASSTTATTATPASTTTTTATTTPTTTPTSTTPTSTTPTSTTPNTASAITVPYFGINFLQDLNAPTYAAKYVDNGVNTVGSVTFSPSSTTTSMTPASDGGISYGPPISNGSAISSNSSDRNLPAIAMLCQKLSAFPGTNGDKSTDVLVAASATRLLQASDLAGKSLNFYREDCVRGGTFPASANGSAVFDANGNLTFTDSNTTTVYSAATVTSALNGQPAPYSGNGFAVLFGYKYARQDGSIAYGLVAHLAPQQTGLTKGVVSTFTEQ